MKLLFVNCKKNWGGIATISALLMRALQPEGTESLHFFTKKRADIFVLPEPITNIPVRFGFNYNPFTILKIVLLIKKHQISHVVVNIAKEIIFGGIAARICGIKCIRLIGNELDFEKHRLLCSKFVDLNIFPSRYSLDAALKKFNYTKRLRNTVVYCGVEERQVSEAEKRCEYERLNINPEHFIIGCTGRVVRDKGVKTLFEAFAKVSAAIPQAILVINGKGNYLSVLRKQVSQSQLDERVRIQGFAPDCLISASIYDIAVMPSHIEGFPNTVIEYMSLGKCIITTAVGGIPEALQDGVNGLFFKVEDTDELANKLVLLFKDEQMRQRLGVAARERYLENYTSSAMAASFLHSLEQLS